MKKKIIIATMNIIAAVGLKLFFDKPIGEVFWWIGVFLIVILILNFFGIIISSFSNTKNYHQSVNPNYKKSHLSQKDKKGIKKFHLYIIVMIIGNIGIAVLIDDSIREMAINMFF